MSRYCSACVRNVGPNHLSTKAHRAATRPRRSPGAVMLRARPAWMIALRGPDQGSDEENAAAASRLGIDWPPRA